MTKPAPLVPPEVDLRSLEYMPLYIAQLTRSKSWLITKRRPELTRPLLCLWIAAWQSTPAGSIEADDDVISHACEITYEQFFELKTDLLRGWKQCADGRYYLPAMVPMVQRGWDLLQRKRKAGKAGAKARWGSASHDEGMAPAMTDASQPHSKVNGREVGREVGSKRKGGANAPQNSTTHPRDAFLTLCGDLRAGREPTDPTTVRVIADLGGIDQLRSKTPDALRDLMPDFEARYRTEAARH